MLYKIEIQLNFPQGVQAHPSMGSVFHGALMEKFSPEFGNILHEKGGRPYSQCVYYDERLQKSIWHIGIIDSDICKELLLLLPEIKRLALRQRGYTVALENLKITEYTNFAALAQKWLGKNAAIKGVELDFVTPTAFKQQGKYVFVPDERLIIQSLLNRWLHFERNILEAGIENILANYLQLDRYKLMSVHFGVEGSKIQAFQGKVAFRFLGDDMIRKTMALLFDFAPFAGVGIKTALGMGCVKTQIRV